MKENIISYLRTYGQESFQQRAFNGVDALILCQFSYLKFEGIIPELSGFPGADDEAGKLSDTVITSPMVTILDIWRSPNRERMFYDTRFEEENRALAERLLLSRRFQNVRFGLFTDFVDAREGVQFSALTCLMEDGTGKVIYRGTDESLVGWREDLEMAFTYPAPGQEYSVRYLERAAGILGGPLDVLGHSKGGNLAVYAAMNAGEAVRERINIIYNMDGPGFYKGVCGTEAFQRIELKIQKFIPRSSLVGMILENYGEYRVVDSTAVGLLQHFPCSWAVDGTDFAYLEKLDEPQRKINASIQEWLERLSEQEQREFVNTLFEVLEEGGFSDLVEFTQNYRGCIGRLLKAVRNQDPDKRRRAMKVIGLLFQIFWTQTL